MLLYIAILTSRLPTPFTAVWTILGLSAPHSPLWADAEYLVPAQSAEGVDGSHGEGSRQGRRHHNGDDIKGTHYCLLDLAGRGRKQNSQTHTLSHSHTVYLVVFAQVYSQSVDEPDGGCRDRDSTLISAHLTCKTVL